MSLGKLNIYMQKTKTRFMFFTLYKGEIGKGKENKNLNEVDVLTVHK
jgi:hypothetical protein